MIINIILIILLASGLLRGFARGGVIQLFSLIGFIIALVVARLYSSNIGNLIQSLFPKDGEMWMLFYNAIGFVLLFFIVQIIISKIASMFNIFTRLPVIGLLNRLIGGALGFIQVYIVSFVILVLLFLMPIGDIKEWIENSKLALYMINETPVLSDFLQELLSK